MSRITIRVYGPLNDFLPPSRRGATLVYEVEGSPSVKDAVEAVGVPHPEIDLIAVNGAAVDFSYRIRGGDRVSVYPRFHTFELAVGQRLQPPLPAAPAFVADVHLGRLAGYLRLLGFDTQYRTDYQDEELVRIVSEEPRVLLTRDVALLKHGSVTRGSFVRATQPAAQVIEVLERFDLAARVAPFTRCLRCNSPIRPVEKAQVSARLEPRTRQHFHRFWRCTTCERIYWEGSHYERLRRFVEAACAAALDPWRDAT